MSIASKSHKESFGKIEKSDGQYSPKSLVSPQPNANFIKPSATKSWSNVTKSQQRYQNDEEEFEEIQEIEEIEEIKEIEI